MRKAIAFGIALALVTMVFASTLTNAYAANVDSITPSKGKIGNVAVIHGNGLKGGAIKVKFGSADPVPATASSDKVGKCTIPNKHATDPDPVPIKIFVDGVLVSDDLTFEYDPAGPEPMITDFTPPEVMIGTDFSIEIAGTNFMTPHGRIPDQIVLIGPEAIWGWHEVFSDTGLTAKFPGATIPGEYEIVVGFSDGSGASAEGFRVY
ncbi:MAG: IPT/TIG domain-containing protein [Candidatus Bathyarchaeota archaeon]|nr:MAG: IPT/TIG domain-containing protein [Candidatus Bathyarchaeota archaeon]